MFNRKIPQGAPKRHAFKNYTMTRRPVYVANTCHPSENDNEEQFEVLTIVDSISIGLRLHTQEYKILQIHVKGKVTFKNQIK